MNTHILRKTLLAMCLISGLMFVFNGCTDDEEDGTTTPEEVTLTFGSFSIAEHTCGESFTKDNITLTFEPSYGHEEDCANDADYCNIGFMNDKLMIGVGRAIFDISKLGDLKKVTVTLTDYCGVDCAKVILLDKDGETIAMKGNTIYTKPESFIFDSNLDNVHSVAVSGCECHIETLTVNYES